MTEIDETDGKRQGEISRPRKLELKRTVETGQVRQSFAHGRSKMVTVEVRKKRTYAPDAHGRVPEIQRGLEREGRDRGPSSGIVRPEGKPREGAAVGLTSQEKAARARALQDAIKAEEDRQTMPLPTLPEVEVDATEEAGEPAIAPEVTEVGVDAEAAPVTATAAATPALPRRRLR